MVEFTICLDVYVAGVKFGKLFTEGSHFVRIFCTTDVEYAHIIL
jgi:hypothetical protein